MDASSFFARALQEGQRYGDDVYVFVRELAQNARDARAHRLAFTTEESPTQQSVCVADDGTGMSYEHARRFLFRLYASSKETDPDSAGQFGVGFWSILRWNPEVIEVRSRPAKGEPWAVRIEVPSGEVTNLSTESAEPGTQVRLIRRTPPGSSTPLAELVRERTAHYCRHLRQAIGWRGRFRPSPPLEVRVDGQRVDEPLALPGPVSLRFRSWEAEGVVGLGPEPKVQLYARGLLLTEVAFLEELEPGKEVPSRAGQVGGLSPVVKLNSDRLEVVLTRRAPRQTRALRRLVRLGQSRVRRLVGHVLDEAVPRPWPERLRESLEQAGEAVGGRAVVVLAMLWLATLGAVTAWALWPPGATGGLRPSPVALITDLGAGGAAEAGEERPGGVRPYANLRRYRGPVVDVPRAEAAPWGLRYRGDAGVGFRVLTLDAFEPERGWVRGEPESAAALSALGDESAACGKAGAGCVEVALTLQQAETPLILPAPTGYQLIAESLRLEGASRPPSAGYNAWGEVEALAAQPLTGTLHYRLRPAGKGSQAPLRSWVRATTQRARTVLPASVRRELDPLRELPVGQRAARARRWAEGRLEYAITPAAAAAFSAAQGSWVERVLQTGAGDCDVKNGLLVLALHDLEVPARLVVGIGARGGGGGPGYHAWAEAYWGGRWRALDASGSLSPESRALLARLASEAAAAGAAAGTSEADERVEVARAPATPAAAPPSVIESRRPERMSTASDARPSVASAPVPREAAAKSSSGDNERPVRAAPDPASAEAPRDSEEGLLLAVPPNLVWGSPQAALGILALVLLAAGLALWRRRAGSDEIESLQGSEGEALARILIDALTQPQAWRGADSLWRRRVLPVVRGRRMSLAEAMLRAQRGTLWISRGGSALAQAAAQAGSPVLHAGERVLGRVVGALGRGMDLDRVESWFAPPSPDAATDPAGSFQFTPYLEKTNRMLREIGLGAECRWAPGLTDGSVVELDLRDLRLPHAHLWPPRVLALNPRSPAVRARLQLWRHTPAGFYVWIDWLLDRAPSLSDRAPELRRRAAEQVVDDSLRSGGAAG